MWEVWASSFIPKKLPTRPIRSPRRPCFPPLLILENEKKRNNPEPPSLSLQVMEQDNKNSCSSSCPPCSMGRGYIVGLLLVLAAAFFFHEPIQQKATLYAVLRQDASAESVFRELVNQVENPREIVRAFWDSKKVVPRQQVASYLRETAIENERLADWAADLAKRATLDIDESVRNQGLAALEAAGHPDLPRCIQAQFENVDPDLRLLGLRYLRKLPQEQGVPPAIALLDDPDLKVVASAEISLRFWTGIDFGVRLRQVALLREKNTLVSINSPEAEDILRAIKKRRQWWGKHSQDYAGFKPPAASGVPQAVERIPAGDFTLPSLDGSLVQLSDFRGKAVLLNFWTTWCVACQSEIPDLVALQEKHADDLVVLGISLDGVPDSHGHIIGMDDGHSHAEHHNHSDDGLREKVLAKVRRKAHKLGISYPVLLDTGNVAGGRFNGGELPTNVLIDATGQVRRRFVGPRSVPVFEAMLHEINSTPPRA